MALTVLEIIQRVAHRHGIPKPASGIANNDPQVIQLIALLNGLSEDLDTRRSAWFGALWVYDNSTVTPTPKRLISRDDDTFILPEPGPLQYLLWKWKSAKGLDYAEDFAAYERWIGMYMLSSAPKDILDMGARGRAYEVHPIHQAPWVITG